ncbi:centromere protein C isoform X1 [Huso huso]|uniref:Centromere protein C isoform X1 n=1 Tax=Huso huso TaxID=61971 RepID=A0ABR1AAX2_HUSHU
MNNNLPTLARAPVRLRYINHWVAERQSAVPKLGEDVMDLVEDIFDHLDSPHSINYDYTPIPKNWSTPINVESLSQREMGNEKSALGNANMKKTVLPKVLFGEGKSIKKTNVKGRIISQVDKAKKSSLSRADSNSEDPSSALLRSMRLRTPSTWWAVKSDNHEDVEDGLSNTCSFNRAPSPSPPSNGGCCSHQEQTQKPKPAVEVVCTSPAASVVTSVLKDDENENSIQGSPLLLKNQTEQSPKKIFLLPVVVLKRLTFNDVEAPPLESVSSPKRQNKEPSGTPTPPKRQMLVVMSPTSNEEKSKPGKPDAALLKVSEKVKKSRFLQKDCHPEKRRIKHLLLTPPKPPQNDLVDDDFIFNDPEDSTVYSWITIPKKKKDPPVQTTQPEQNWRDQKKINDEPAATKANKNQVEAKQQNTEAAAMKKENVTKKAPVSNTDRREASEIHSESDAEEGSLEVINNLQQTETNANKKNGNQAQVLYKKTKVAETKRQNKVKVPKSMKNKSVDSECGSEQALMLCLPQLSPEDVQPAGIQGKNMKETHLTKRRNKGNKRMTSSGPHYSEKGSFKSKKTDVKQSSGRANKGRAEESKTCSLSSASAGSKVEHYRTSSRQKTAPGTWWIVKSDEDTATMKNLPEQTLISKVPKASRQLKLGPGKIPESILKKNDCESTRSTDVHESTAEENDDSEEVVGDWEEEEVNEQVDDPGFFKPTKNQTAAVQRKSRLPSFKESLALGSHLYATSNFKTSLASFSDACAPAPVPSRGKSSTSPVPSTSKGQMTIRSPVLSAKALIHKNDPKSIDTPQVQRDLETDSDSCSEGDFHLEGVAPLRDPQTEQFHSGAEDGASEDEQGMSSQGSLSENSVTDLGQHHSGLDLKRSAPVVKGDLIHFEGLTSVLPTNTPERRSEQGEEREDYRITQPEDFVADDVPSPEQRELGQPSQSHDSTRRPYYKLIPGTLSNEMMAKLYRWLCGPEELAAQGNYNETRTKLQDENGRVITIGCVKSIDMHNFKWYKMANNYMGISKDLAEPTFTHGKVLLGPYMEKPCQYVHTSTMVLNVVTGSVNVYIHLSKYELSTGNVFYVPPGNIYRVINITDQPALLYFTKIKVR